MKTTNRFLLGAAACLALALYAGAGVAAGLNVASDPVIFGGLTSADTEENPVCFDQSTGQLGQCGGSGGIYPANIIWVAQSGGDYTDLREALASIIDADTNNRYLIHVAPGVYELGATPLVLKPFVDIEGSGMHLTVLRGSVGSTGGWTNGYLVQGANDTVLKDLTLKNDCNHQFCAAMYNQGASPTTIGVKIVVTNQAGSVTNGVHNEPSASPTSPTLKDTIIEVGANTGGSQGVYGYKCEVTILRSKITVNGAGTNEGVTNHGGTSFIDHSTIKASTNTVLNTLRVATSVEARIYASRLSGGAVAYIEGAPAGSFSCAGVTDENNTFYPDTCP